jgi:stage II sporulation protein R
MGYKVLWMVAALLTLLTPSGGGRLEAAAPRITIPRVVRFRVIANSDSPTDQAVKLVVRDVALDVMEPALVRAHSERQAISMIDRDRVRVLEEANRVLMHFHMPYRASVVLTRTVFPTKIYGTLVLPAGTYTALLIKLGRAEGHNWWCVLYPSLCFIDMTNGVAVPQRMAREPHRVGVVHGDRKGVSWRLPPVVAQVISFLKKV